MSRLGSVVLTIAVSGATALAATYTVTNTGDSGAGSLRDAINQSNASVGVTDTIAFNITGAGCAGSPTVCTIKPTSTLPAIFDPVIIDGYTQPGSSPNTLAVGDNAVILVEIDGSAIGGFASAFQIATNDTIIKGLVINRWTNPGIAIDAGSGQGTLGGHVIRGCFIGTDPTGTVAAGNGGYGIFVRSPNNAIGGPNPADRNVIAGKAGAFAAAIRFEADSGATVNGSIVQGNYIGTNAAGTGALGAGNGIYINPGSGLTIGGAAAGEGNLISGNTGYGIDMDSIGCTTAGTGNVIQGNLIGVDATGTLPLPNAQSGIHLGCVTHDNQIGGTAPGAGNLIANNGVPPSTGYGIFLDNSAGVGNAIRANLIYGNSGLGIALGSSSPIPNDPGDGDTGPNNLQNFPIVSSATPGAGNTHIIGALHSTPSTAFDLDFFSNVACIPFPHEYLEGRVYLGSGVTTTDGSGTGLFDLVVPVQIGAGEHVTATATDPAGNTSEISQRLPFTIFPASGPPAGGTSISINGTDFAAGAALTIGGFAATNVNVGDSTFITATTPALPAGSLNDVTVTNTDGSSGTLLKGFVADFLDVPSSYQFYSYVTTLVSNAITVGCGSGNYCPSANVTRAQMAVFLLKAKYGLCYTPPPASGTVFLDVSAGSFAAAWIEALANLGVTTGCGGGNYCPTGSVTRAQMAVFLLKTYLGTGYMPPACASLFGDVVCPSQFADWIEDLYTRSITGGCQASPLLYCPSNPNTRGQMAVFITKTFGLQ
jgi:hypothetical protein